MITPFTFQADNETLAAYRVTNRDAPPTLLFLHGAGSSNKERALPIAQQLLSKGYGSLLFDFSGHGNSTGELSNSSLEKRVNEAEQAFSYLDSTYPHTIVAASMGGHIALELLKRHPSIESIILLCPALYPPTAFSLPFTSAFSKEIRKPDAWRHNLELLAALHQFTGQLLVIIGESDTVIPSDLPQVLLTTAAGAANKELLTLPKIDHGLVKAITEDATLLETITNKMDECIARLTPKKVETL